MSERGEKPGRPALERTARWLSLGIVVAILVAPLLGHGSSLHGLFAPLCHQMPERSPALFGVPFPVCFRCLGMWLGVGLVAWNWTSRHLGDRKAWPLLLGLGVADFALSQLGAVADVGAERLVSGLCLGIGLPLLARAIMQWMARRIVRRARAVRVHARWRAIRY